MFWLFTGKKEVRRVEEEAKKGFEKVKTDLSNISRWIKHLDSEKNLQNSEIETVKEDLATIKTEIEGLKNMIEIIGNWKPPKKTWTRGEVSNKQTAVEVVETDVETAVETPKLENFSITEKTILWVLLNTDMKLSYEDLAAMLNKEKSTIRSQINGIKQKSEIIQEIVEKNGKKRLYIPEKIKEKVLKKSKVRVRTNKKGKKEEKNE